MWNMGFVQDDTSEQLYSDIREACRVGNILIQDKLIASGDIFNLLSAGVLDIAVTRLDTMPIQLPEGIVITALRGNTQRGFCLISRKGSIDNSQPLFLPSKIQISTVSPLIAAQLTDYRSDLQVNIQTNVKTLLRDWKDGLCEAIAIPVIEYESAKASLGEHEYIPLHPREIIPPPGHGVIAFICLGSNTSVRKALLNIHQPEVSACTNIERKVLKILNPTADSMPGVYCEKARNQHYQVRTFYQYLPDQKPIRTLTATTTTFELAERVVASVKAEIPNLT